MSDKQLEEKPIWAGKSGPGYEFDEDGDLIWFASVSFMKKTGIGPMYRPWTSSTPADDAQPA